MIENYDDKNRDQTLEAVEDLGGERLADFLEFEREHKNRKTVVDPLERELVDVVPTADVQYVAGRWWDDPTEVKTVRRDSRIDAALEAGELQEVE